MSLMKTLAKVAVGVAIAKGVSSMTKGRPAAPTGSTGADGLFRGPNSAEPQTASSGKQLEGMMDQILGGSNTAPAGPSARQSGGLGGLLEQLSGGTAGGQTGGAGGAGGLNDLLGGLSGSGGLGGILGGLAGALQGGQQSEGSFGDVLRSQFDSTPEPAKSPTQDQEAAAGLMLSAMLQAAKSDGKFDRAEQTKLMEKLGDVSPQERAFVEAELKKPVDVRGLAGSVPRGMQAQVYLMSVLGIDLDSQAEAQYLHELATEMSLDQHTVNAIHDQVGVTRIYR